MSGNDFTIKEIVLETRDEVRVLSTQFREQMADMQQSLTRAENATPPAVDVVLQDHEKRLRKGEKMRYALPITVLLLLAEMAYPVVL